MLSFLKTTNLMRGLFGRVFACLSLVCIASYNAQTRSITTPSSKLRLKGKSFNDSSAYWAIRPAVKLVKIEAYALHTPRVDENRVVTELA